MKIGWKIASCILAMCWFGGAQAQDGECAVTLFAGSVYGQSQHSTDTAITPAFSIDGNGAGLGYGCRWRNGPWVGGLEADYMKTSTKGSGLDVSGFESSTEVENTGTLRLTGGFMLRPKLLVYLTGGFSTASVKASVCPTPASCVSDAHRLYGGVFGGGLEYAFTRQFSARLEALWFGLDNKTYFAVPPAGSGIAARTGGVSPDIQTIRAGLSWHF
jgi:outer membrane immunogenic protein